MRTLLFRRLGGYEQRTIGLAGAVRRLQRLASLGARLVLGCVFVQLTQLAISDIYIFAFTSISDFGFMELLWNGSYGMLSSMRIATSLSPRARTGSHERHADGRMAYGGL